MPASLEAAGCNADNAALRLAYLRPPDQERLHDLIHRLRRSGYSLRGDAVGLYFRLFPRVVVPIVVEELQLGEGEVREQLQDAAPDRIPQEDAAPERTEQPQLLLSQPFHQEEALQEGVHDHRDEPPHAQEELTQLECQGGADSHMMGNFIISDPSLG